MYNMYSAINNDNIAIIDVINLIFEFNLNLNIIFKKHIEKSLKKYFI